MKLSPREIKAEELIGDMKVQYELGNHDMAKRLKEAAMMVLTGANYKRALRRVGLTE